jgi:hypothetical protein
LSGCWVRFYDSPYFFPLNGQTFQFILRAKVPGSWQPVLIQKNLVAIPKRLVFPAWGQPIGLGGGLLGYWFPNWGL